MWRGFGDDLRLGWRVLRGNPGPTATAVLTLALGIAANTTVFSWVDAVLLRPIPGTKHQDRLVSIETVTPNGEHSVTGYRDYRDYRDRLTMFDGLAGSLLNVFSMGGDDRPELVWGEFVSGNYFEVLGVQAEQGRVFSKNEYDDRLGAYPVAVISHGVWMRVFHGDRGVLGRTIRINKYPLTVVGIVSKEFAGSVPGLGVGLWVPMVMGPMLNGQGDWLLNDRTERQVWITGPLKPGVSLEQARAEVSACARALAQENPNSNEGFSADVLPVWKSHFGVQALLREPLKILLAVGGVLFLIVVSNVASLQLAKSATRQKELCVRMALGANAGRLTRQMLAESLLLSGMGAAVGVLLTMWLGQSLVWLFPPTNFPLRIETALNGSVLAFMAALCLSATVLTGMAPALYAMRANVNETLKGGGRGNTASAGVLRTRGILVVAEVALALTAVVGTGLLAQSFRNVRAIHPGFNADNVLFAKYYVETFCRTREERLRFCLRLRNRLQSIPGVEEVSYANAVPLEFGSKPWTEFEAEGYVPGAAEDMRSYHTNISPGHLRVMRIDLLEGRDFTERDDARSPRVVIVNQAFAKRYFGGANPVGRKLKVFGRWSTVVGLAKDSKYMTLTEPQQPFIYAAGQQASGGEYWMAFFIRQASGATGVGEAVRRAAAAVESGAGAVEFRPFGEVVSAAAMMQRVAAILLAFLGGISVLLAGVGLYSLLAYGVSERTQELGIRMAMGAQPWHVLVSVVSRGMAMTGAGIVVGVVVALAGARLAAGLLVGVSASEPAVYAAAAGFLGLVALAACSLPARRATKVDPFVALRGE